MGDAFGSDRRSSSSLAVADDPGALIGERFRVVAPIAEEAAIFVVDDLASGARMTVALLEDPTGELLHLGEEAHDLDGVIVPIALGRDAARNVSWAAFPALGEPIGAYRARRGALAIDEVADVVRATCEVVALLHGRGIDHAALTPWSIFRRGIGTDPELAHVTILAPSVATRVIARGDRGRAVSDVVAIAKIARFLAGDLEAPVTFERWCARCEGGAFGDAEEAAHAIVWGGDVIDAISSRRALEERIELAFPDRAEGRGRLRWIVLFAALAIAVAVFFFLKR